MTANDIRTKYLDFYKSQGHMVIPPAPIVPPNDPTTLFTPFGMQQLVPYLKGEPHPMGKRLVDSQPAFRSDDIPEVGDNRHTTFFEMLGNWSLGDYFKKEQLPWFFAFLTKELNLDPKRLYASVFAGSDAAPKDEDSIRIWQELFQTSVNAEPGIEGFNPKIKIYTYPAKKNWWSRAGVPENMPAGEIGGPDSEVFFDVDPQNKLQLHEHSPFKNELCHVNCDCGRFMELGNSVFMEYIKQDDGSFKPLPAQNVDFGGGLVRIAAAVNDNPDVFATDLFSRIIQEVESISGQTYQEAALKPAFRVIADHLKGAVFLIQGGVEPANKLQGYFLRRLLRRVIVKLQTLKGDITASIDDGSYRRLVQAVMDIYTPIYFQPSASPDQFLSVILAERDRFAKTLTTGIKMIRKTPKDQINGQFAFNLYQSYGFPLEITQEVVEAEGINVDTRVFAEEFKKHQELSRTASAGMFKGGLADHSEVIVKYHTTTHLLHQALRDVLGDHVHQMGSNITADRLRFDFKHPQKVTPKELKQVESIINSKIEANLPVTKTIESKDQALQSGALAFFREKYPDTVSVYTIGKDPKNDWYSKELCGGPHVSSTGQIGPVRIKKEEAVGAGVRRVYVVLASSQHSA